jgi:hypothetical protein
MSKTINKITIPIHEIKDHRWFTHQIENGNQWKSLYSPYLLKSPQKYSKIHVLWKCNQNKKSNMWYSTPKYVIPLQSTYISTLIPKVSLWMSSNSKNSLPWAIPMSVSIWTTKQNSTRIQNINPSSVQWPIPICNVL